MIDESCLGSKRSRWSPNLLTLLEEPQRVSDGEFARRLAEVSEEEVDQGTTACILAAEAGGGELISHEEMRKRRGM